MVAGWTGQDDGVRQLAREHAFRRFDRRADRYDGRVVFIDVDARSGAVIGRRR